MHVLRALALAVVILIPTARGQESYSVEALKSAAPAGLAAPVKEAIANEGVRVLDAKGKPFVEIWTRKAIPATGKPSGAKGTIQFPELAEGELLGVARFVGEGHDYRDQTIPPGLYTIRYGLQPVNGDHLGVSPNRDYALLLPAAKDGEIAALPKKTLETRSAETAGSGHPAVLMLLATPKDVKATPVIVRDEAKNTWGAVLSFPLSVKGEASPVPLAAQLVLVGMAM
ncbi:MAG: hypothetical protein JWN86_2124 [Planctomycetota bacterium]|nr:hypothetical protein [Planctomycetota bacterium]